MLTLGTGASVAQVRFSDGKMVAYHPADIQTLQIIRNTIRIELGLLITRTYARNQGRSR